MEERPSACRQCKKPVAILYQEITEESTVCTQMCSECPVLQQKMHGLPSLPTTPLAGSQLGVGCGHCGTTLLSIRTGSPLGCAECYAVFEELLVHDLVASGKIPARLKKMLEGNKKLSLHIGKAPDQIVEITPSSQIITLNEALNEALRGENYEQAAWLRDQIKSLTEKRPLA